MKTIFIKESEQKRDWFIIDAAGKPLGRVAAKAAAVLRGKHMATFTPNQNMGGFVVIINADKVIVTGKKRDNMLYRHYTGYVSGLREESFAKLIARRPAEPLTRTIKGMLPHTRLGRKMIHNLRVYAGEDYPQKSQNPKPLEI